MSATDFNWFEVLRAFLTRNQTVEEQALHTLVGFHIVEDRLDAEWPKDDPAILVEVVGGDEAHGTGGNVVHPTLEIWSYGSDGTNQDDSKALERALGNVLNGAVNKANEFGTLQTAHRERPSTSEWDPDTKRAFQRATYRTWFSSVKG